jgi:hypothetical protein
MAARVLYALTVGSIADAHAQVSTQPGDFGVFADEQGTQTMATVAPYTMAYMYAVVFDVPEMAGFEFSVSTDPALLVTDLIGYDLGSDPFMGTGTLPWSFAIGVGCCSSRLGASPLIRWTYVYFQPQRTDMLACVEPFVPSSFDPPTPGYLDCVGHLIPFGIAVPATNAYPAGCFVVNPSGTVATSRPSWGTLKGRYAG